MDDCLRLSHVSKTFPPLRGKESVRAVDDVSFILRKGESLGIIGPSGCGKTTLTRMILGLLEPDSGVVEVNGRIGFVAQNPYASLDPTMSVYACIAEPLRYLHICKSWAACADNVADVMRQVRLDYGLYKDRLPYQLSGGERQRVSIARALVHRPDLLILDEPTSMIDQEVRCEIMEVLKALSRSSNRSFLMVTHDITISAGVCDTLLVMNGGRVIEQGETQRVLGEPREDLTRRLVLAATDVRAYWDSLS